MKYLTPMDPSFRRVQFLARALIEEAKAKQLSATKPIRLTVFGAVGEAYRRTFIVSFAQPLPSRFEVELWVNPLNARIFKSIPEERIWKPVLTRSQAFLEEISVVGQNPIQDDSVGQPVQALSDLQAIPTDTLKDKTMYYVENERGIYALDLQSSEPEELPTVVAPLLGQGRWYLITSTSGALGNIDGGFF